MKTLWGIERWEAVHFELRHTEQRVLLAVNALHKQQAAFIQSNCVHWQKLNISSWKILIKKVSLLLIT